MVRPLLHVTTLHQRLCFFPNHAITLIFAFMSVFTLISVLAFMCASHKNIKPFKPQKSRSSKFPGFNGNIGMSGKALLKMVSWQRVQHEVEDDDDDDDDDDVDKEVIDEDVVWRKTIIMGGRCRPLEFSGKIEYDCEGNPLPVGDDAKPAKKI